jgi:hypothetical protein
MNLGTSDNVTVYKSYISDREGASGNHRLSNIIIARIFDRIGKDELWKETSCGKRARGRFCRNGHASFFASPHRAAPSTTI